MAPGGAATKVLLLRDGDRTQPPRILGNSVTSGISTAVASGHPLFNRRRSQQTGIVRISRQIAFHFIATTDQSRLAPKLLLCRTTQPKFDASRCQTTEMQLVSWS